MPYLDYKERGQQWKWIGAGRDSDKDLLTLYQQWVTLKQDSIATVAGTGDSGDASAIPPPRM